MKLKLLFSLIIIAFFASCSSNSSNSNNGMGDVEFACNIAATSPPTENAIRIEYNGESVTVTDPYNVVAKNGANVSLSPAVTDPVFNVIVSGTTSNGSLRINGKVALHLNGVNITNPIGPAINIQTGKEIAINLIGENYLADGRDYEFSDEDAKGTIFSEGQIVFEGGGALAVSGRRGHAIATDDYFEMKSGCIVIKDAAKDGIHANDSVLIKGGTINVVSVGDAIQSEGMLLIFGGQISAKTTGVKSHGIVSGDTIAINGNATNIKINVSGNGSKGINSTGNLRISNGTINIYTSGSWYRNPFDKLDSSRAAGIKADQNIYIEGGNLAIESVGNDSRGMNVNGSIYMSGGKIDVVADGDAINLDGELAVTAGSGTVTSKKKDAIDCGSGACNKGNLITKDGGL